MIEEVECMRCAASYDAAEVHDNGWRLERSTSGWACPDCMIAELERLQRVIADIMRLATDDTATDADYVLADIAELVTAEADPPSDEEDPNR